MRSHAFSLREYLPRDAEFVGEFIHNDSLVRVSRWGSCYDWLVCLSVVQFSDKKTDSKLIREARKIGTDRSSIDSLKQAGSRIFRLRLWPASASERAQIPGVPCSGRIEAVR